MSIAWIAGRQHGRIAHAQLVAAGVDRDRIKRWRADGRLRPVHVGVYAVGHTARSLLADLMAAALAGGTGAAVTHQSAGHAPRLGPRRPPRPEITVPTTAGRTRAGIVLHRVKVLHPLDTMSFHGVRMATPARVLVDLSPRLAPHELTRAGHEAWIRHGTTHAEVKACIAGDKVDCHWPAHGLTGELLSYRFHASRRAFEEDVARRRRARHIAYTWGDVFERGARTIAELAPRLA